MQGRYIPIFTTLPLDAQGGIKGGLAVDRCGLVILRLRLKVFSRFSSSKPMGCVMFLRERCWRARLLCDAGRSCSAPDSGAGSFGMCWL